MTIYALSGDLSRCSEGFLSPGGRVCVEIGSEVIELHRLVGKIAVDSGDLTKVVHSPQELAMLESVIGRIEGLFEKTLHRGRFTLLSYYGSFADRFIYKDVDILESVKRLFSAFKESIPSWSLIAREAYKIHGEAPLADAVTQRVCAVAEKETKTGVVFGIYGLTNESRTLTTLNRLKVNQGVHVGFSGWFNFDVMAKKQSDYAVLCDFNVNVQHFLRASLHYLRKSKTRHEFACNMRAYLLDQDEKLDFVDPIIHVDRVQSKYIKMADAVNLELVKRDSWLGSDTAYAHVKNMAEKGRIAVITANVQDSELFAAIRRVFDEQRQKITSLYVSNILPYCKGPHERERFYTTIETLSCPETELIASVGLQQYTACFEELERGAYQFFECPFHRTFFNR